MKAWVEWNFAEKLTGFDCSKCPTETQARRRCHDDRWDHDPGGPFPIRLRENGSDHQFCPAKLFRDDPEFVARLKRLWLAWKMGQVPDGGSLDSMDDSDSDVLFMIVRGWEVMTRHEDFRRLASMFCGESK